MDNNYCLLTGGCAHPTHFAGGLDHGAGWTKRIHGLRANASRMSIRSLTRAKRWTPAIRSIWGSDIANR